MFAYFPWQVQRLGKHMGTAASIENAVKGASPEEIKAALAALPKDHVACSVWASAP